MKGKIVFGKLNVDENRTASAKYGIMNIPTILICKNGQLIDTFIGAMPESILKEKNRGTSLIFSFFISHLQILSNLFSLG